MYNRHHFSVTIRHGYDFFLDIFEGLLKILILILFTACNGSHLKAQNLSPKSAENPDFSTSNHLNSAEGLLPKIQPVISSLQNDTFKKNEHALQSAVLYHSLPLILQIPKKQVTQNLSVNWTAFMLTSGALAGIYTGLFKYGETHRWDANKVPLHFKSDFNTLGIDKIGHFYAAKTHASIVSNLYRFSGLGDKSAAILGSGVALSIQSLIEIKDGTISGGGFDTFDELANILGAGWFFARENSAFLQRFNIRWFYYPSENREILPDDTSIIGDYNGHTYWLGMHVWDLLPEKLQPYWPKFIVPSAGVSLNDWSTDPNQNGELSYHLSLNLNFKHIIPQKSGFARAMTEFLNGFYIPAPALEVYPNPGVKLIFFGQK